MQQAIQEKNRQQQQIQCLHIKNIQMKTKFRSISKQHKKYVAKLQSILNARRIKISALQRKYNRLVVKSTLANNRSLSQLESLREQNQYLRESLEEFAVSRTKKCKYKEQLDDTQNQAEMANKKLQHIVENVVSSMEARTKNMNSERANLQRALTYKRTDISKMRNKIASYLGDIRRLNLESDTTLVKKKKITKIRF